MANPSIRGHRGQIKLFRNGALLPIIDIVSAEVNQDSTFQRTNYAGRPLPEGDQAIEGWSGSMDLEVKDAAVDELIDALVTDNLNGIGVGDHSVLLNEQYSNGQIVSYVYFDVQFKMSKRQAGLTEKMTKRLDFQASGRVRL